MSFLLEDSLLGPNEALDCRSVLLVRPFEVSGQIRFPIFVCLLVPHLYKEKTVASQNNHKGVNFGDDLLSRQWH
jgi:hypothetical protein